MPAMDSNSPIEDEASRSMDPGEVQRAIWGPRNRNLTIGLLLTVSMTAFEALAVATALPVAVNEIGGIEWYGWVFSGFMLANLVSLATAGQASDRGGATSPFVIGCSLFVLGLLGAGFAPTMPVIVVCRVAQGLGAGAISAVAYAAIARGYPAAAHPRMIAMLSSAWVVPGLIGPALAGAVADYLSWRWVFLGLVPSTVVASAMTVPSLRLLAPTSVKPAEHGASQTIAAMLLASGTAGVFLALSGIDLRLAAPAGVLGLLVAVPALRRILPEGSLTAQRGLPAAISTTGLISFSFFAAEAFLPLAMTQRLGQSTSMSGLTLTAATVTWTAGAWLQARLIHRTRWRTLTVLGLGLIILGVSGIAIVVEWHFSFLAAVLAWGLAGLGMGIGYSTLMVVVLEAAPKGAEGSSGAAAQLVNVLGAALGTGVGGVIVAAAEAHSAGAAGIVMVDACAVAGAILAVACANRLPDAGRLD